jgi:5-formyltetrahydrofolate cyclo-ligase
MNEQKMLQRRIIKDFMASTTPKEREAWSKAICENVIKNVSFRLATVIVSYTAMPTEANPAGIIEEAIKRNKRVYYPVCMEDGELAAARPWPHGEWAKNKYGIWEPVLSEADLIEPEQIELIITPGTAFDQKGGRLGHGGGYYDRFIKKAKNAYTIGICFERQVIDNVTMAEYDVRMDAICTEKRFIIV